MLKFAFKLTDKVIYVDGATVRVAAPWVKKRHLYDPFGYVVPGKAYGFGLCDAEWDVQLGRDEVLTSHMGNGEFSSPPGSYLNRRSIGRLGRYLYTCHHQHETHSSLPLAPQWMSTDPKMIEWDGVRDNVDWKAWPSGYGARFIFGYAHQGSAGFQRNFEMLTHCGDIALTEFHGHMVGIMYSRTSTSIYPEYPSGDEAVTIYGRHASVTQWPSYITFWFNPLDNSGSGLTKFNFHTSGVGGEGIHYSHITEPSWMNYDNEAPDYTHIVKDAPYYNYNMTDIVEFQDWLYACNACHLVRFGSGVENFQILYNTGDNPHTTCPRWLEKFEGNLYMLEASGVVSRVTASGDDVTITALADLSYKDPGNIRRGGIHAREWGSERATKDEIVSYNNKLHVFLGMGSGLHHFAGSGDMSLWTDYTEDLPDLFRTEQGNIYTTEDLHDGKLYVLWVNMSLQGFLGISSFGDRPANMAHLYSYNGTVWSKHAWFPIPALYPCGGFTGFDYQGPHVFLPSGVDYPIGGSGDSIGHTPVVYKCKDYAVVDFQLIDELSRNIDVEIEYSIDDGCTWATCKRFKDYQTLQPLGEGLTALNSSPSGEWHNFYWDFVNNVGYNVDYPYTKLRIIPSISNTQ
jgi:hypothetical protein